MDDISFYEIDYNSHRTFKIIFHINKLMDYKKNLIKCYNATKNHYNSTTKNFHMKFSFSNNALFWENQESFHN